MSTTLLPGVVAQSRGLPLPSAADLAQHRTQLLAELHEIQRRGRAQRAQRHAARAAARAEHVRESHK